MAETTLPQVPRLATAVEAALARADSCGRDADERDLLHALAEQPEAVAGKALSMSGFRPEITLTADVARRSCVDVLVQAEDVAVADGSFFLATEHVLYSLLRPGTHAWEVLVQADVDPRLVRGQAATEASEIGRPIETVEVRARASGIGTAWASRVSSHLAPPRLSVAERIADGLVASDAVVGLAVITFGDSGTDVAVRGSVDAGGTTTISADSPFRIGSLTKVLTAVATLALAERGEVSLDEPVSACLRSLRVTPEPGPTLRQLLTHTGGVPAGAFLHTPGEDAPEFVDHVQGVVTLDAAPGDRWLYSNVGYAIAGQALADALGQTFDQVLDDVVLSPLGMKSTIARTDGVRDLPTGYWIDHREVVAAPTRDIILRPAGGAVSTPRDIARFLGLLAAPAEAPGAPISSETAASMYESQDSHVGPAGSGAGLGLRLRQLDGSTVGWHPGRISGFPSAIYAAPGAATAVLANTETLAVAPAASTALRELLARAR